MIHFRTWVDRYVPKGSYTFSISKTVSNFTIRFHRWSFNFWWPVQHNPYYDLNKVPWRRIILYCKARPYFCWCLGHDYITVSMRGQRCRWCSYE